MPTRVITVPGSSFKGQGKALERLWKSEGCPTTARGNKELIMTPCGTSIRQIVEATVEELALTIKALKT